MPIFQIYIYIYIYCSCFVYHELQVPYSRNIRLHSMRSILTQYFRRHPVGVQADLAIRPFCELNGAFTEKKNHIYS